MGFLRDFVRFNRYKNVESFNNASDITSSTISIVKLDENNMDIYLGRTQLTHSELPDISIELRRMIDSLENRLSILKEDFNSNLSSMSEEYNKRLSEYISKFEKNLNDLNVFSNNLSKEISNIKSDCKNKYDNTSNQIKDLSKEISNINDSISRESESIDKMSNTIGKIELKQISSINDIKNLKKDVSALKIEDKHILELISGIKSISPNLDPIKQDILDLYNTINSFKKHISTISENKKSIDSIKIKQSAQSKEIKEIKNDIVSLHTEDIHILEILNGLKSISDSIVSDNKYFKEHNDKINNEILSIKEKIKQLTGVNVDDFETLEGANRRLTQLEEADKKIQNDIDALNEAVKGVSNKKLEWLIL